MEISIKKGDILLGGDNVIAHQVNCLGVMGSGVALAIKNKYPRVYSEYVDFCKQEERKGNELLGNVQLVEIPNDNLFVANLFGQLKFSSEPGVRSTSYDAIYESMSKLRDELIKRGNITTIGFPYGMSSVRAGADWNVIYEMIKSVFKNTNFKITIWKL